MRMVDLVHDITIGASAPNTKSKAYRGIGLWGPRNLSPSVFHK